MSEIIYWVTIGAFTIWTIRSVLFLVSLWQNKEYRFDRFLVHSKENPQGKKLFLSPFLWLKIGMIAAYILVVFTNNKLVLPYQLAVASIFGIEAILVFKEILKHQLRRPKWNPKGIFLVGVTVTIIVFLAFTPLTDYALWLLFLDRLTFPLLAFFIFFLSFPTELYRDYRIYKARRKLQSYPQVLVIGITGSYGKSSTKHCVAHVLAKKFRVLATKGSNNTPIGIANTILSGLTPQIDIFVTEMGAYKRGEIRQLCEITPPKIGILTGISTQHLSLFGSLNNTMKGKYELIASLPKDGLALFNKNNPYVIRLAQKTRIPKISYGTEKSKGRKSIKNTIVATNIIPTKEGVTFDVVLAGKKSTFFAPVLGTHAVENLLPAIYLGHHLGMSIRSIKQAVATIPPLTKTMVASKGPHGVTLVDDTFNASPNGVEAAVSYMQLYKGKKILVLSPMIELGKEGHKEHYQLGRHLSRKCDYVFLTNDTFYKDVLKGVRDGGGTCFVEVAPLFEILSFIKSTVKRNDVVVFEGKEPGIILRKLPNR